MSHPKPYPRCHHATASLVALGALLAACSSSDGSVLHVPPGTMVDEPNEQLIAVTGDGASRFVSQLPGGNTRPTSVGVIDTASADAQAASTANAFSGGVERAVAEADILQRDGDRLFALSRFSGLSVVDVSDPTNLRLEGSYRSSATPFEMYVEDGIVFAMFNDWSTYVCDEDQGCRWEQTSRMQALDARNPTAIELLADLEVPGRISDSRRVGDVLYLVTAEDGWCWGCQDDGPNITVSSFNVASPADLIAVDQLRMESPEETYIGRRSVFVTEERVYISGWQWTGNRVAPAGSIQVVNIADPVGHLQRGARLEIAGQIDSRWQMDEHDGVLRVISQPGGWGASTPPVVETFRVRSAMDIEPAASLEMVLPRPEFLRSVRFDGERAYAITSEGTDPLFAFDLSDPDNPEQVGELEIPGWIYHMEPRGERLLAFGFDNSSEVGSLNVSLFDVSVLGEPTLLDRAEFGGDWGSFAENQDRVHKAFSILDEEELILVPYSGAEYDMDSCRNDYVSGIQLVDYAEDSLTVRGSAPHVGRVRRALLHRDHLLGIGDNAIQSFDIGDRSAPTAVDQLEVARNISSVRVLGDQLMRFGYDWWTNQTIVDLTPLSNAGQAAPQAVIDLSALFEENAPSCNGGASWGGEVFVQGQYAYVPRYVYDYGSEQNGFRYEHHLTFYVVDLSDSNAPRTVGQFDIDPVGEGDTYFTGITRTENTLLVGRATGYYQYGSNALHQAPRFEYDIVDLAKPEAPVVTSRFEVPRPIAQYGWGYGVAGTMLDRGWGWYGGSSAGSAVADGDLLVSQHSEPLGDGTERVRFFMDRLDLSDPARPRLLAPVNVPGSVVHFDAETGQIVTIDYHSETAPGRSWGQCRTLGERWGYNAVSRQCGRVRRSLNALVLEGDQAVRKSQLVLDGIRTVDNFAVSDSRVFYTTVQPVAGQPPGVKRTRNTLESLRVAAGRFERLPSVELEARPDYWQGQLFARNDRAFVVDSNRLRVIDTAVPAEPVSLVHDIPGWGCTSLEVGENTAYCALGQRGVEVINLSAMR